GSAWVIAKTMIDTMTSVSAPSARRRTMKAVMPRRRLMGVGGPAPGGPTRCRSREGDRPEAVPVAAERQRTLARLEPHHLRAVRVHEVVEAPDEVAAAVVLHPLHLVHDGTALRLVGRLQRLLVERDELRVAPVRLVVRRVRQAARRDLVPVVPRAPVVGRKRVLQVLV